MKVGEFINILRSFNPDHEILISSTDDFWTIEQSELREETIYTTSKDFTVGSAEYDAAEDGTIASQREALLIPIDLDRSMQG